METIQVYTSDATDQGLVAFVQTLAMNLGRAVQLLPLAQLPAPDPLLRNRMRVERGEVLDSIWLTEFSLEQYQCGAWPAEASHEAGLKGDLDALKSRLRGLDAVLSTGKGGEDNA